MRNSHASFLPQAQEIDEAMRPIFSNPTSRIFAKGGKPVLVMETQDALKRAYEASVSLSWAMVIVLVLSAIVVEIVRMQEGHFAGWSPQLADGVRDYVYGVAIVLPLSLGYIRKAVLKGSESPGPTSLARRLRTVIALTMLVADMPALLGFGLFLLGGFYREFYIALGYSLMVLLIYFPRASLWESWLGRGDA
jgi:hypothetical protein